MDEKEIQKLLEGVSKKNGEAIAAAVKTEMEAAVSGLMKADELDKKFEALGLKKDTIDKLTKAIETQGEEMRKVFTHKGEQKGWEQLVDEQADNIKKIATTSGRTNSINNVKIVLPGVKKTEVTRASVTDSTMAYRLTDVGQLPYLGMEISPLFRHVNVGPNSNGIIRYIDQLAVTRNAAFTAESAVKPESVITWQEYTLALEKVADTIPVTKEAFADVGFIKSEVERLLSINLALIVDDELYDGSGVTPHLKGVYTSASTFNYAAYTGVTALWANIADLVMVMAMSLSSGKQSKYKANTVIINPADYLRFMILKDLNANSIGGTYLDSLSKLGIKVVSSNQVTANTMVVGDFRYGTIYDLEGVTVEMGYINDQFVQNTFTILAEQRLGLLIRTVDADAFLKVTNITAALNYIGRS